MKIVETIGAQGDVLFCRVLEIPTDATAAKLAERIVVAHSETGHHHAILDALLNPVALFETPNRNICYLRIDAAHADVVHERSFDTHETVRLPGGGSVWRVHRQREWTPEGWQRVAD